MYLNGDSPSWPAQQWPDTASGLTAKEVLQGWCLLPQEGVSQLSPALGDSIYLDFKPYTG